MTAPNEPIEDYRFRTRLDSWSKISTTQQGVSGDSQELRRFCPSRRCEASSRRVHPQSRHQAADAGKPARFTSSPKAFELLSDARPGSSESSCPRPCCSKRLWPETFVAEANLSNLVAEIREALGDRARSPLFVRTAHGFGYAFCGDATRPCQRLMKRESSDPRAGSSGAGGAFLCQQGNTWWDAIRMSRSGSTRRRSPAVTRGSW